MKYHWGMQMKSASPTEAHSAHDLYLIDVREPDEVAQARVEGAHHIPLGSLADRLDEVPRDRTVHVMCHAGGRSARATQFLEAQGVDAVNVDGGITERHRSGLPVTLGGAA
jgi:rhodanese-related sulfurtransferase